MKSSTALLTLFGAYASAHTMVTHMLVNGGAGDASCIRRPPNTNPVIDLAATDMACNVNSNTGGRVRQKCAVRAGDHIGFEWRTDPGIPAAKFPLKNGNIPVGVVDDSHKGPCAVYMKKVDDAVLATASGNGWFKIMESGLDGSGVFCTDRIRLVNGHLDAMIPTTIAAGDYLVRAELLTLNNAGPKSIGGQEEPQFYVGCAQITVSGSTGTGKPQNVAIPGYVSKSTPGMIFDIWNSPSGTFQNYPSFGPALFESDDGA